MIGFQLNGTTYYYVRNLQGDVTKIISTSGTVYATYTYDAWGKCTVGTNTSGIADKNPIRYRGYYYDVETGLYSIGPRYYDPEVGRWINPDLNGGNGYAFCGNDPVNVGVIRGQMQAVKTSVVAASSLSKIAGIYSGGVSESVIATTGSTSAGRNGFFNQNLVKGKMQGNEGYLEGSITALYREGQGRFDLKIGKKDGSDTFGIKVGYFDKISVLNLNGSAGFGDSTNSIVGLKGVVDVLTVTTFAGVLIDPVTNTYFAGVDVGVAVATGRAGITIGNNVEVGVYGEALGASARFGIQFKNGELILICF